MKPMTYHQTLTKQPCQNLKQVRGFLRDHGTALAIAANKLDGPTASARVFLRCEAVRHARQLPRAQSRQLVGFHRLLTLEQVDDPNRTESGLFVQINLAYGFVAECCSLFDKLHGLLKSIAQNDPANDIRCVPGHLSPHCATQIL
ncbi:hypothetical protein [Tateyamaria sp.]|uniref:hypothetical protein n=1 Tax=Tateyamaria sp. TaxID=1929288 RepID=UPI0039B8B6EF